MPLLLILNTMILPRLTILGLAGILELYGAPGSKSGFHRTGLDRSSNPVQSSPKRSLFWRTTIIKFLNGFGWYLITIQLLKSLANIGVSYSPHVLKNQLIIFFRPRALLKISPFKAAIISSSSTSFFIVRGFKYIKSNMLLRSAFIGSGKKYSIKIAAFSSLL